MAAKCANIGTAQTLFAFAVLLRANQLLTTRSLTERGFGVRAGS
jgi:hypothetical protein